MIKFVKDVLGKEVGKSHTVRKKLKVKRGEKTGGTFLPSERTVGKVAKSV